MRDAEAQVQGGGIGERSLALKLVALLAAVLLATGALAILTADLVDRRDTRQRRLAEARGRALALARLIAEEWKATGAFPQESARRYVSFMEEGRKGWDVAILRGTEVLAGGVRPVPGDDPAAVEEVSVPLAPPAGAGGEAAAVRVRLDLRAEYAEIDSDIWGKALLALVGIVGAAGALYLGVDRLVLAPLHRLHRATVRMAAGGAYEPVEPRGRDEIGALTAQVNRVVAALMAQEAAVRRSEALNRAIADTALDLMITADASGTVLSANPAVERVLGWRPSELVGRPVRDLVPERWRAALGAALCRPAEGSPAGVPAQPVATPVAMPVALPVAIEALHRGGRVVPVEVASGAATTPDGWVLTLVLRDLTRQRAVEAQLLQAQKMEAVGTLAGGIAHDFNNLLSVIIGQADLARTQMTAGHPLASALDAIVVAAERGAALTSRLLGFARRSPINVKATDVAEVVGGVRTLLSRTFDRAVEIREEIPAGLPPILADAAQVEQALMNLCINARDAMPSGGVVTVSAAARRLEAGDAALPADARPGAYVRLSVADTGTGMAPEVRTRLFEPFFTTKERGRGTGLGLPMVYGVARGHGGFVGVETAPGKGSRFDLWFPVAPEPARRETRAPSGSPAPSGSETLLVIDDDDQVRRVIVTMLQSLGYRVLAAEDGASGLEVLRAHPEVALVVLDMILPGIGGAEAYRRIRAMRDDVRVLLSTGYMPAEEAREILSKGGDGILMKPYRPDELGRTVRAILDGKPRPHA